VNLTLVSGRPISFTMDLYQPLYIPVRKCNSTVHLAEAAEL